MCWCHSQPACLLLFLQVNAMMHPGVVISGLMLLLTAAVDSYTEVLGVVGQPVTLPCTYMASNGTLITCWGRGDCSSSCSDLVIWMDGHRVYYQKDSRYQLKGQISQGNVSLTIGRVLQSDSGSYCCRVQTPRWISIQVLTFLLKVRPETSTSPLAIPTMTMRPTTITKPTTAARPTTISKPATTSTRATQAPMSTRVSTSTPPILVHTQTPKPVAWNGTVTRSSDEPWNHHTEAIPTQKPWLTTTKEFIIGISITVLVLLILVSAVAMAKYICKRKKTGSLSLVVFRVSKIGDLQNKMIVLSRVEDKVDMIEDSLYVTD